jgi:hypothetical protein
LVRSHGGAAPGLSNKLSAGMRWTVLALETGQMWAAHRGLAGRACLWITSSKSLTACALELSGFLGSKALLPASRMDCITLWRPLVSFSCCVWSMFCLCGGRDCGSVQKQNQSQCLLFNKVSFALG